MSLFLEMNRAAAQEEFFCHLLADVHREAEKRGDSFYYELARTLFAFLESRDPRVIGEFTEPSDEIVSEPMGEADKFFAFQIFPRIDEFANDVRERNMLIGLLLHSLSHIIYKNFRAEFYMQEFP